MTDTTRIRVTLDVDITAGATAEAMAAWVDDLNDHCWIILDTRTRPVVASEIMKITLDTAVLVSDNTRVRPRETVEWTGHNVLEVISFILGTRVKKGDLWPKGVYTTRKSDGLLNMVVTRPELSATLAPGDTVLRSNIDGSLEVEHGE